MRKPKFIPGRLYQEAYFGECVGETILVLEVSLQPETIVVEMVRFLRADGMIKLEFMVPENWGLVS